MKKFMLLLSVATLLATTTAYASEQSHRHTPRTKTNVTMKASPDSVTAGIVAYSDTTDTAYTAADDDPIDEAFNYGSSRNEDIEDFREVMSVLGTAAMIPIIIVAIIFIGAPAIIIFIICYFIYKNRQQKLKLAEMAMQNGQPIPDSVLGYSSRRATENTARTAENATRTTGTAADPQPASGNKYGIPSMPTNDMLWRKGVMKIFIGIGLMFFLDALMGNLGFSIGVLVALYGAGQTFIAWTSNRNQNNTDNINNDAFTGETIKTDE